MSKFPQEEKLKSRKLIGRVFSEGFSVKSYPVRIQFFFHDIDCLSPCQMGVSVPKRNFKKAVDRNRIKRQLKEVYRLNKAEIIRQCQTKGKRLSLMIIYTGREVPEYSLLDKKLVNCLQKIKI